MFSFSVHAAGHEIVRTGVHNVVFKLTWFSHFYKKYLEKQNNFGVQHKLLAGFLGKMLMNAFENAGMNAAGAGDVPLPCRRE